MTILQLLGVAVSGLLGIAALSLIVNPQAHTSEVVKNLADGFSSNITAAKRF